MSDTGKAEGPEVLIGGVSGMYWLSANAMGRRLGKDKADELRETAPAAYGSARRQFMAEDMIDDGIIPPWYTVAAVCAKCGPVMLGEGSPREVAACPWCSAFSDPLWTHDEFVEACRVEAAEAEIERAEAIARRYPTEANKSLLEKLRTGSNARD